MSIRVFYGLLGALVLGALALRLHQIDAMLLWHDEAVNGTLTRGILEHFHYRYHYRMFHGPSLFYLDAIAVALLGHSHIALRIVSVLSGTALVAAVGLLREPLGRVGALFAALGLALAPVELYYSRVGIHEMLFVALSLGLVGCVGRWLLLRERSGVHRTTAMRWGRGALVCLGGMFATKETVILTLGALTCGLLAAWCWGEGTLPVVLGRGTLPSGPWARLRAVPVWLRDLIRQDGPSLTRTAIAVGAGLVVLFSSFFTFPPGVLYFFAAFFAWAGSSTVQTHLHQPFTYFLELLRLEYWPFVLIGLPALIIGCLRRERVALFLGGWTFSIIGVYSILPYKTPWCVLNLGLPVILGAGYGVGRMLERLSARSPARSLRTLTLVALLVLLVPLTARSLELTYERYDDRTVGFIWAPTRRELSWILQDLAQILATSRDLQQPAPDVFLWHGKEPLYGYLRQMGYVETRIGSGYGRKKEVLERLLKSELVITDAQRFERTQQLLAARLLGTSSVLLEKGREWPALTPEERQRVEGAYMVRWYPEMGRHVLVAFIPRLLWQQYLERVAGGQLPPPASSLPPETERFE